MTVARFSSESFAPDSGKEKFEIDAPTQKNQKPKEKSKSNELKRMTITLQSDTAKMLELLSELQEVTQVEALRRAISTEAFIQNEVRSGSKILVQTPNNQLKELVFR